MLEHLRGAWTKVITPVAKALIKMGLSPDVITWTGTIATILISLICFPQGWLWQGVVIQLLFIFSDSLDGTMARLSGGGTPWGAFLDSTLDRIADGAVFGGLAIYYAVIGEPLWCAVGIMALVFGQVTSYSKARGEAGGWKVNVGIVGRADRLVIGFLGTLLTGLGVTWALPAALVILLIGGIVTVGQRMKVVFDQTHAKAED